ncbi:MAG TPA: LOG family protein, partial [Microthrixaceae bacterium]|nr:LOG family protein [Microthrixaceae bacterium]
MTDTRDTPRPRTRARRTDPVTESAIDALLDAGEVVEDRDLYSEMMRTVLRMARDGADRGDVKITNGALRELRSAYRRFAPYRATRKVSVFGSARTHPDDPAYVQAVELGGALARHGFMVITGGGPGIMTAAIEGAGRENSFVVTIRLPFEDSPPTLVDEERWVRFRYFFTRKLTFMKESSAYVVCPGGFGTMDETFELLTLIQTGKETPAPVVLIDPPDE